METNNQMTQIYKNYLNDIYRYSLYRLGNKSDAEDITSETFTRFFEKAFSNHIENEKLYLLGICRNLINEKFKLSYTSTPLSEMQNKDEADYIEEDFEDLETDVEKQILKEESLNIIKDELNKLDDESKEVITLKIWEELTFGEIGKLLQQNESAIKLRFYRGLEKIKVGLGERKDSKYLYSVSLPAIATSIAVISKSSVFSLSSDAIAKLAGALASKLIISKNIMETSAPVAASGGILSSAAAKVGLGVTTVAVIATGTIGIVSYNSTDNKKDEDSSKFIDDSSNIDNDISLAVDTQKWSSYTVTRNIADIERKITINYPSDWELKESGDNSYSVLSPSGSAFGYDIGESKQYNCEENQAKEIIGKNNTYKRFYNDQDHPSTNWYVCEFDASTQSYYYNTNNQFTYLAKSDADLLILDEILKNVVTTETEITQEMAYFKSSRYDVEFYYPKSFGDVIVSYHPQYFNLEGISFTNTKFRFSYPRVEGGTGIPLETSEVQSMDGKTFLINVFEQGVNKDKRGILAYSEPHYSELQFLSQGLLPEEVEAVRDQIEILISNLRFGNLIGRFVSTGKASFVLPQGWEISKDSTNPNAALKIESADKNNYVLFLDVFPSRGSVPYGEFFNKDIKINDQVIACEHERTPQGRIYSKIIFNNELVIIGGFGDDNVFNTDFMNLLESIAYKGSEQFIGSCAVRP